MLKYTIAVHECEGGGFVANIIEMPGCITQGETESEVLTNILDAKSCWLEAKEEMEAEL